MNDESATDSTTWLRRLGALSDLGDGSPEVEALIENPLSEWMFSPRRADFLGAIDFDGVHSVLEVGAGAGPVTRALGERIGRVLAVEPDPELAAVAAARCRDLGHVDVVVSDIRRWQPSTSFDLIVVHTPSSLLEPGPMDEVAAGIGRLIDHLETVLAYGGAMMVLAGNRLGLHNAANVHPGNGLAGFSERDRRRNRPALDVYRWREVVESSSLPFARVVCLWPNERFAHTALAEEYLGAGARYWNHFEQMSGSGERVLAGLPEPLAWWFVGEHRQIAAWANGWLIGLGRRPGDAGRRLPFDFAHAGGLRRRPGYRAWTRLHSEVRRIERRYRYHRPIEEGDDRLRHHLPDEPFHDGPRLSRGWIVAAADHDREHLGREVREYMAYLDTVSDRGVLPGEYLDLLPHNVIRTADGQLRGFDHEWSLDEPVDTAFVLFRALLYFAIDHRELLSRADGRFGATVGDFVAAGMVMAGVDDWPARAPGYLDLEAWIQARINGGEAGERVRDCLATSLTGEGEFEAMLFWRCRSGDGNAGRPARAAGVLGRSRQRLRFVLPASEGGVEEILFSVGDGGGRYHLYSIEVTVDSGDGRRRRILALDSGAAIAAVARRSHTALVDEPGGGLAFVAESAQSRLGLDVPVDDSAGVAGGYRVEVEMDWPERRGFDVLRRHYLDRLRQADETIDRLASALEKEREVISSLRPQVEELRLIRSSRVWRWSEAMRRLVYGRLLSALPALQRGALRASRAGAVEHARRRGIAEVAPVLTSDRIGDDPRAAAYRAWRARHGADEPTWRRRVAALGRRPKFSIVMPVHETEPTWLRAAIDSVRGQWYDNWELCIVDDGSRRTDTRALLERIDDPRIRATRLDDSVNIVAASNHAIGMADGDFLAFLDHDDELAPHALAAMAAAIDESGARILYSDEDYIDPSGENVEPHFKPDWSPDLLLGHNYITHLLVVERRLAAEAGALRAGFDGAQDYDLLLRLSEIGERIFHVADVLYHWRRSPQSSSTRIGAKPEVQARSRRALADALERRGIDGEVLNANLPHFFRVRRRIGDTPLVSVIVPFRDRPLLLERCLNAVLDRTGYPRLEIVGVSNDSRSPLTFSTMDRLSRRDRRVRFERCDEPFNFSRLVNLGAAAAAGSHLVLLNNDVEVINGDWLESLLEHSLRDDIGAVGGRLLYPDNTIQHAGLVVGIDGYAGHSHKGLPLNVPGYFNRPNLIHEVSAVTGAFMMVDRGAFEAAGGFDERSFAVACNDVDFCLRLAAAGLRNLYTPYAQGYHMESASRGYEDDPERRARFEAEKARFRDRHGAFLERGDPYYNVHLTRTAQDWSLRLDGP